MRSHTARPRIQQAFIHWLRRNQDRFRLPIRIRNGTNCLYLEFSGITPAISAVLGQYGIDVVVEWQGKAWDILLWLDALPVRCESGFVCEFCEPEKRIIYPARELLWREHVFEPFLKWVNSTLAQSSHLALYGQEDSSTYAMLLLPGDNAQAGCTYMMPIHELA